MIHEWACKYHDHPQTLWVSTGSEPRFRVATFIARERENRLSTHHWRSARSKIQQGYIYDSALQRPAAPYSARYAHLPRTAAHSAHRAQRAPRTARTWWAASPAYRTSTSASVYAALTELVLAPARAQELGPVKRGQLEHWSSLLFKRGWRSSTRARFCQEGLARALERARYEIVLALARAPATIEASYEHEHEAGTTGSSRT